MADRGSAQAAAEAYDKSDRFLRNNLDDTDYAAFSEALECVLAAPAPTQQPAGDKYDDVLLPFLSLMRKELHANSRKGDRPGWLAMDANTALLEIYWHTAKLSAAVKNNAGPAIMEHSADVANMAMMVLDVCGGIALIDAGVAPIPQPELTDAVRWRYVRECIRRWGSIPQGVMRPAGGAQRCTPNEIDAACDRAMELCPLKGSAQ